MPAIITQQPTANQLLSAYKPMVIACTATTSTGGVPTLVLCDVYINSAYYRTFFSSKADKEGKYTFDIQDAVQERLTYFIPPIDGKKIEINNSSLIDVVVKLRTSKLNASGLNEFEQTPPIPGTDDTLPSTGQGVTSNKFFALNILIQNEENQDINSLCSSFKTNDWNDEAIPLTRRNKINFLTANQSSYFPFLSEKDIRKVKLFARLKGSTDFQEYEREIVWADDINEVSNPPTINIKWLTNDSSETITPKVFDLKFGAFVPIKIKTYPEDPDSDIEKVELFSNTNNSGWISLGELTTNIFDINILAVGKYQYKAIVTDSKANFAESNILVYEIKDTTPAPGTITLEDFDNIVATGGLYSTRIKPMPDGEPDRFITYYSIDLGTTIKDFYEGKGMIASELRIKFTELFDYNSWRYNNTVVTESNYSSTEVMPSQLTQFNSDSDLEEVGTAQIIHEFQIYHTADPLQVFTNYLQMQFE